MAFGGTPLSEIGQEIAQQSSTIHPSLSTSHSGHHESGQHHTQDQIQDILGTEPQWQSQERA